MEIVLKGIFSGFVLAILVGPVFFTLLQTSIERGFSSGVYVAIGISASDALYISLSYLGFASFFNSPEFQVYLGYIGGFIIFCFGAYYLFIKSRKKMNFSAEHVREKKPLKLMAKGFIINGFNPMVLIFWIGTISIATGKLGYTKAPQALTFLFSIVGTVFITDLIKAKLADQLRVILTPGI
ncbi:MAG TPA: LysE family transporter, partial [Cyclobacteriaceae bacterium]|nr:LysE family transporter [Cyclobacteriaceae bacterium]